AMRHARILGVTTVIIALAPLAGCAVPQGRGEGKYMYLQEPTTKAWYHFYLPVDYVKNRGVHPVKSRKLWPLVMTFHGMKPYDNAHPQEREWEKEADFYGYIVCAPELKTCDSFMEYPLTKEHDYVLQDRRNVMAIMDHVFATTRADPKAVLATSWSCGGYLAHYFANRFPKRFSCIATRLSNFSAALLKDSMIRHYRQMPVAIFIGDGDFQKCRSESQEAVAWYKARDFAVVRGKMIDNMGHRRIPQTAAAFFAEQLGIRPLRPAEAAATVAQVKMTEYYPPPELIARMSPVTRMASRPAFARANPYSAADTRLPRPSAGLRKKPTMYSAVNAGRSYPFGVKPSFDPYPRNKSIVAPEKRRPNRSAADSTRVARGSRPANWLDPTKPTRRKAKGAAKREAPGLGANSANRSGRKTPARNGNSSAIADSKNASPRLGYRRSFTPSNAGPQDYPVDKLARRNRPSPVAQPTQRASVRNVPTPMPARSYVRSVPAKRVNIQLGGPAIGIAPHYLDYSVDLPRNLTAGADFLWMDNGVWMGDEGRGVRILDIPGLHRISVLVITKNNQEFRGSATVQVLKPTFKSTSERRPAR
ncbi:MAG: hypothetical protein O7D94_03230, partial [Planctomycetota bacterium]|nr:hypothetical protein [Planctomycetota bacterium]